MSAVTTLGDMSEIRYPEGPGAPFASTGAPAAPGTPQQPDEEEQATPADSPWQAAVIRVSVLVAIWLGY